jgi:hypothetical protein
MRATHEGKLMPPTLAETIQELLHQSNMFQAQLKLLSLPCTDTRASLALRVEMSMVLYHTTKMIDHLRIIQAIRLPDVQVATEEQPIIP